jgi:hypothetical protein
MTSNWPNGTQGTGGSSFTANLERYDAVPYLPEDFNGKATCTTESGDIENYKDANQVQMICYENFLINILSKEQFVCVGEKLQTLGSQ